MYRILIVGEGYTAHAIATYFRSKNQRVFSIIRDGAQKEPLEDIGAEPILADLSRPGSLRELPVAQFVVMAPSAAPGDAASYRKAHCEGVSNFLGLLRKNPDPNFILYISSTEVWGNRAGEWVDETVPAKPDTECGKILLEAEEQVLRSGYASAVFRIGTVYGPGQNEIQAVREGRWPEPAEDGWLPLIHRDDLMNAMPVVFKRIKTGGVLIGVDDEPVLKSEFYRWLCRELGVSFPGGIFQEGVPKGARLRNTGLKNIGFNFQYPAFDEGYRTLLAPTPGVGIGG